MDYKDIINGLVSFNRKPTGNRDWDAAVLSALANRDKINDVPWLTLHQCALNLRQQYDREKASTPNLADPDVYNAHSKFLIYIADSVVLAPQRRKFIVDDDNKQVLRFLLLYFNNCPWLKRYFLNVVTNCTRTSLYRAVWVLAKRSSCKSSASI